MFTAVTTALKHDRRVILLDIPGSIESAQSLHTNNHACRIKSTPALSSPYPSNEPKGQKLALALNAIPSEILAQQQHVEDSLVFALDACKERLVNHDIPWCLPRVVQKTPVDDEYDLSTESASLVTSHPDVQVPIVLSPSVGANRFKSISELCHCPVINSSISQITLDVGKRQYLIPSQSTFVLSSIEHGMDGLGMAAARFDLILMDPPWSNRSVRRAATYKSHEQQREDPFLQTLPVLKNHLKPDGLVAVWITNKHAIRAQVVEALHEYLRLVLVTEWWWLKVTDQGEPVTAIRGIWRKPYETLLVFSRTSVEIPEHVIVAVPDLHSRKPSLKHLLAAYLPESYSALEIFARSLTAGWWSIGDQVLKFQDTNEWEIG